jgi:BirA family biotin operon repressor/biotin-[acetyl-CoA-carboxylase] ligase
MDTPLKDIRIGLITSQWAENNNLHVIYNPEVRSSNDIAKEEAFNENLLTVSLCLYLTDHQTAGRGRGDHSWSDDSPGGSLLSSWSYLLHQSPRPITSCLVGLALFRACSSTWPFLPWNLKAPNDLYIHDKKIGGVLLETVIQGGDVRMIMGIGLNILESPKKMESATSLLKSLPEGAPLLGEDYLSFLDRLLFELTDAVSKSSRELSATDRLSLLIALNKNPLLQEKYTRVSSDGSLQIHDKKINWITL